MEYREPFKNSLGSAIQWYDCLLLSIRSRMDQILQESWNTVLSQNDSLHSINATNNVEQSNAHIQSATPIEPVDNNIATSSIKTPLPSAEKELHTDTDLSYGQCAKRLQDLCPLCFGGSLFGRTLQLYVHSASLYYLC
jgi:hypothetical protein